MPDNINQLLSELGDVNDAANGLIALKPFQARLQDLAFSLDETCKALERATITARNTLERLRPAADTSIPGASALPYINISGTVRVIEYNWLHIKLNTLLPHCRFQAPQYLKDTIARLLDDYETNGGHLPFHKNAMLVIDEHCDMGSRKVFDQDNKNWKIIPNALKGRVFFDDDQFSLGVALVSTISEKPACNIFVIDASDTGEFFSMRFGGALYW